MAAHSAPYLQKKTLRDGIAYYFNPPSWARLRDCPIPHTSLGCNKQAAFNHVWSVLYPQFVSWNTAGASDIVEKKVVPGTFEWLMLHQYPHHRKFSDLKVSTQLGHTQRLRKVCDLQMPDGSRLGHWPLVQFEPEVVDTVFEILLADHPPIEVTDEFGQVHKKQPGLTQANHIMKVCNTAWNVGYRSKSSIVPKENPFSKMRLRWHHEATYKATWSELMKFVCAADELGHEEIGTAALVAWEWCQRPTHIFRDFFLKHYRPDSMPNNVLVMHPKNREKLWVPLFSTSSSLETPHLIFPLLAPRLEALWLDAVEKGRTDGPFFVREHLDAKTFTWESFVRKGDDLGAVNAIVAKIVKHAGLKKGITLENFRHGGITELGDSDLTDTQVRAMTRHASSDNLPTYIEPTQTQVRLAQARRLETRVVRGEEITHRLDIPLLQ